MPVVRLTDATSNKLKLLAIPLEDNFESVISRLADAALARRVFELPSDSGVRRESASLPPAHPPVAQPPVLREAWKQKGMDMAELYDLLGKIGKGVFVKYFSAFGDQTISNQEMIAMLPQEYTFKSRTSRTSKSRRIFKEGLQCEALRMIADSGRIDDTTARQAKRLLDEHCGD